MQLSVHRPAVWAAALALTVGCADSAPPRRQVLVIVDTDALTLDDVAMDPELSGAAVVDTVRIDVLDEKDSVRVLREFSATSRLDWPFSFTWNPPEAGDVKRVTLRIRAFRARDAESTIEADVPTLSPIPELSLDRVVQIMAPAPEQIARVHVHLSAECLGRPASFRDRTSCEDAARPATPFGAPLPAAEPGRASRVGTSPLARSVPCASSPAAGRVCIPGG